MNGESVENIALKDVSLFKDFSAEALARVKSHLKEQVFGRNDMIFFARDYCRHILIVQSGQVKIFLNSSSGKEQILQILGPGETCVCNPGEPCWNCFACAQALTDCRVWFLQKAHYIRLIKTNLKLTHRLNEILAQRLSWFNFLIEEISLDNSEKRLIKFILEKLNGREQDGCPFVSFTHEELSQWIGVTRETVTRQLNKLKRLELIEIRPHQILVRDRTKLEKMAAV